MAAPDQQQTLKVTGNNGKPFDQESTMQGLAIQNADNMAFGGPAAQAMNVKNNTDEMEPGQAAIN